MAFYKEYVYVQLIPVYFVLFSSPATDNFNKLKNLAMSVSIAPVFVKYYIKLDSYSKREAIVHCSLACAFLVLR